MNRSVEFEIYAVCSEPKQDSVLRMRMVILAITIYEEKVFNIYTWNTTKKYDQVALERLGCSRRGAPQTFTTLYA